MRKQEARSRRRVPLPLRQLPPQRSQLLLRHLHLLLRKPQRQHPLHPLHPLHPPPARAKEVLRSPVVWQPSVESTSLRLVAPAPAAES